MLSTRKILFIDTSDSQKIRVVVDMEGKKVEKTASSKRANAQVVLPIVEEMVRENKLALADLTAIKVNTGPGSFTGLRVGIAVAQMLGTLLDIPVNGQPPGEPIEPIYDRYAKGR